MSTPQSSGPDMGGGSRGLAASSLPIPGRDARLPSGPGPSGPGETFDPYVDDFGHERECAHCGGEGTCDDNVNPSWDCDDSLHPCHSCGGSGKRRDQKIF